MLDHPLFDTYPHPRDFIPANPEGFSSVDAFKQEQKQWFEKHYANVQSNKFKMKNPNQHL